MKYCVKCKETKELSEFYAYKRKDRPNIKVESYCKECTIKSQKKPVKFYTLNCAYCLKEFTNKRLDVTCCTTYHRRRYVDNNFQPKVFKEKKIKVIKATKIVKEKKIKVINEPTVESYMNRDEKIAFYSTKLNKVWNS